MWRVSNKGKKISYPSRTSRAGSMIRRWWSTSWRKFGACWTGPVAFPASSIVSASRWATSWAWFRTFHRSPGTSVSLAPLDSLSSNSNLPKGKFHIFSIFLAVIYRIGKIGWMDGSMSKSFRGWIMQRGSPDFRSLCRALFRCLTRLACQPSSHARCILRCFSLYLTIIANCWLNR